MRLLRDKGLRKLSLVEYQDGETLHYAILLYTWLADGEEVKKIPGFKRSWKGDRLKGQLSINSCIDPDRSVGRSPPEKLPKTVQKDVSQHQER
jgi:hypothetical protein